MEKLKAQSKPNITLGMCLCLCLCIGNSLRKKSFAAIGHAIVYIISEQAPHNIGNVLVLVCLIIYVVSHT